MSGEKDADDDNLLFLLFAARKLVAFGLALSEVLVGNVVRRHKWPSIWTSRPA